VAAALPQLLTSLFVTPGDLNRTASPSHGFQTRGSCDGRAGSGAAPSTCQGASDPISSWSVQAGAFSPASLSSASLQPVSRSCAAGCLGSRTPSQCAFGSSRSDGPTLTGGGFNDTRRLFSSGGAPENQAATENRARHAREAVDGDQESDTARHAAEPAEVEYLADHDGSGADTTSDEAADGDEDLLTAEEEEEMERMRKEEFDGMTEEEILQGLVQDVESVMERANEDWSNGKKDEAMWLVQEAAKGLEQSIGMSNFLSWRLWDQLIAMYLEQSEGTQALALANKVMEGLEKSEESEDAAAVALFMLRRGNANFMLDNMLQCQRDMSEAVEVFRKMFGDDFPAIGEGLFYIHLANLKTHVQQGGGPDRVLDLGKDLHRALKHMLRDETDRGADLRLCAMFAHDEVIAAGLKEGDAETIKALHKQQCSLLRTGGMTEKLLEQSYEAATHLYILSDLEAAQSAAEESLGLALRMLNPNHQDVDLRKLRLGAILLDRGDVSKAAPLVEQSALRLQGEGLQGGASQESWATGEAQFTLSLLRLMQLMPYQISEREELLDAMDSAYKFISEEFIDNNPFSEKLWQILESHRTSPSAISSPDLAPSQEA